MIEDNGDRGDDDEESEDEYKITKTTTTKSATTTPPTMRPMARAIAGGDVVIYVRT